MKTPPDLHPNPAATAPGGFRVTQLSQRRIPACCHALERFHAEAARQNARLDRLDGKEETRRKPPEALRVSFPPEALRYLRAEPRQPPCPTQHGAEKRSGGSRRSSNRAREALDPSTAPKQAEVFHTPHSPGKRQEPEASSLRAAVH